MKIKLEGFADQDSGWKGAMPIYLIRPERRLSEGGSIGNAENVVEDWLISRALGEEPSGPDPWIGKREMNCFYRARKSSTRHSRFVYWSCAVELPDWTPGESGDDDDRWWEELVQSEIQYGAPPEDPR